jgi:hypothetical protein
MKEESLTTDFHGSEEGEPEARLVRNGSDEKIETPVREAWTARSGVLALPPSDYLLSVPEFGSATEPEWRRGRASPGKNHGSDRFGWVRLSSVGFGTVRRKLKVRKTRIGTNWHEHGKGESYDSCGFPPPGGRETGFQAYKRDKLGKTGRF